jgi:hypothetical protein
MEAVCFSETLASTDESKRRQNPEDHHHQQVSRFQMDQHGPPDFEFLPLFQIIIFEDFSLGVAHYLDKIVAMRRFRGCLRLKAEANATSSYANWQRTALQYKLSTLSFYLKVETTSET